MKVIDVTSRFVNTKGGKIGTDSTHLKDIIPMSYDENGNNPITFETTTIIPSNYDRGGHVHILQDEPLPMTIIGIIPKVQVS